MHSRKFKVQRTTDSKAREPTYPLVSIIIPTYNSSRTIEKCLRSIEDQDYKHIEVIVSDNFSSDQTVSIVKKHGFRVVSKGFERAAQKNYGAMLAHGSLLYFIDSDFVLAHDTIKKCVKMMGMADALVTAKVSVGSSFWARTIVYKEQLLANDLYVLAARFLKKDAFFKVEGFCETLIFGEDVDLHRRLLNAGVIIKKVDAIEWHIGTPETLTEFFLGRNYYGKVLGRYLRRDKSVISTHLNPFKPGLLRGVIKKPSKLILGLIVIQIIDYMAALLGLLNSAKDI